MDFSLIGKRVKSRRQELNLTQSELAHLADCRKSSISNIEKGKAPSVKTLKALTEALGVSTDYLLRDVDKRFLVNAFLFYVRKLDKEESLSVFTLITESMECLDDRS